MRKNRIRSMPWFSNAAAICIGVLFYVLLTRWGDIWGGVRKVIGYFSPVILGCAIAYLVNPLFRFYEKTVFRRVRGGNRQIILANLLAYITVLVIVVLAMLVFLPQLFMSITTFAGNLDGYMESLRELLDNWGVLSLQGVDLDSVVTSSEYILNLVTDYVLNNMRSILSSSAAVGSQLFQWVIGLLLSIYLLAEKQNLKAGMKRLLTAVLGEAGFTATASFLRRCNGILSRYIVYNLLDCLIIGVVNAVFMFTVGMPYVGLVSFIVAIANLIPTFGPIVGAVIGAFVLVLVKPWYALAFLGFTLVLQTLDGYVIKPRLFGSSLGVSGLWILIGVIVCGRMFGMLGILLAIPAVAILDFFYREYVLVWLEKRRNRAGKIPGPEDGQ